MFLRFTFALVLAAVVAAFKRTPMQMNVGNKIAAAALTFGLMIQPVMANDQLSSPQFAVEKEGKKAKVIIISSYFFYYCAFIGLSHLMYLIKIFHSSLKFYIGGGMHNQLEKEGKKAKVCHFLSL